VISAKDQVKTWEKIAIINPPESAILAIGSAREVPVVEDGEVKLGCPLSRESHHLGRSPCQRWGGGGSIYTSAPERSSGRCGGISGRAVEVDGVNL